MVEVEANALPVLMVTKGLASMKTHVEVYPKFVAQEFKRQTDRELSVMAVGGPCIARELAAKRETNVVITGDDEHILRRTVDLLATPYYRARTSKDVIGVEVCAAFKNLYAIAIGAAGGRLERVGRGENGALMHNLAAALFVQALAELSILVGRMNGEQASVTGLAGTGDLYVTCQAGRNCRLGHLLGLGLTYSQAKVNRMAGETVEGAELALTIGPNLDAMWMSGALPMDRMRLTRAIVDAIRLDEPFEPSCPYFFET
jgi:glycerol-3-phosphate dehydrogenase (NAD(P)+)